MRQHQPFAELPPRWVLTDDEAAVVWEALCVIQRAREQSDDLETLGRADAALQDVIDQYRLQGERPASQGAAQ